MLTFMKIYCIPLVHDFSHVFDGIYNIYVSVNHFFRVDLNKLLKCVQFRIKLVPILFTTEKKNKINNLNSSTKID